LKFEQINTKKDIYNNKYKNIFIIIIMMTQEETPISFFVEESNGSILNEMLDIETMRKELDTFDINNIPINGKETNDYDENMSAYYELFHTVKDLLKICDFYGMIKQVKKSKCKKQEIIATILYFEKDPENKNVVYKRKLLWGYITELLNDKRTEKYILWD